jgi:hypothetical protein
MVDDIASIKKFFESRKMSVEVIVYEPLDDRGEGFHFMCPPNGGWGVIATNRWKFCNAFKGNTVEDIFKDVDDNWPFFWNGGPVTK